MHIILALLQFHFFTALQPFSLFAHPDPYFDPRELIVNTGSNILLVVGWVVLPYLKVASCPRGHSYLQFGVEMLLMPQFMSDISISRLNPVNNQSREEEALVKRQFGDQVRLFVVPYPQPTLFYLQDTICLAYIDIFYMGCFLVLLHHPFKSHDMLPLQGSINQNQVRAKIFIEVVLIRRSPSEDPKNITHSLALHTGQIQIGSIGLCNCFLDQCWPNFHRPIHLLTPKRQHVLAAY